MCVTGIVLLSVVGASSAAGSPQDVGPASVLLTATYADGRTVPAVVTTRSSSSWTPLFPKIREWRSPDGLAVNAVGYRRVIEGTGVRVDVLLLLGQPHQKEISVATVLVERERPVTVEALREFGVAPVTLAITDYVAPPLDQPHVSNKTTALQIDAVELVTTGPAAFRMTVRNLSAKPVMTFHVATYRGTKLLSSGRLGEPDGSPVVPPGRTFTFQRAVNIPLDSVEVTGLMFEDGSIEGDAEGVATARLTYLGRRVQLSTVIEAFGAAAARPIADAASVVATLRKQIESLSVLPDAALRQTGAGLLPTGGPRTSTQTIEGAISAGMRDVNQRVLNDLELAPRDADALTKWLADATARYRTAYLRFVDLTTR